MVFEQPVLKVEREKEFEELKAAVLRVFAPEQVERFLNKVKSKGLRIRDFDAVLAQKVLESSDGTLLRLGSALSLYQALTLSDQAQMREFYLFKIEEVSRELRARFQKLYRYY